MVNAVSRVAESRELSGQTPVYMFVIITEKYSNNGLHVVYQN